jgi:beta-ureidopropionase / N-carbamoyl-L-amino-acid hydrolase
VLDSPRGVLDPAADRSRSAARFDALWAEIAGIGRDARTGGYRRFGWTETDARLRAWFADACRARGLTATTDAIGNQWAWWGDAAASSGAHEGVVRPGANTVPGGGVVTGSHLDSVPDGGAYDGPLGVVSALAAIDQLGDQGFVPARPIGVVAFVEEEGARFGVGCLGSKVVTGALPAQEALALTDADGTTLAEALRSAGQDPAGAGRDDQALARIGCFVELHIEQGRGLADLDRAVAVGGSIWPHGRWRLNFPGEANHAGTTRLADRKDAMIRCAQAVLAARAAAERYDCLATMGRVEVRPGGVNAIPSSATAWLDARGRAEASVRSVVDEVAATVIQHGGTVQQESWTPATDFDAALVARLSHVLSGAPVLATGAGHDAGILASAGIAAAMLFVRNPTGVSHSPAEFAERADCLAGVDALATVLADLAGAAE